MVTKRRLLLTLYYIIIFLFLDLCVGYTYTKVALHQVGKLRIKSIQYHHDLKPAFNGTDAWGKDTVSYVTNFLGFRDREIRNISLKKGSQRRILFLGDSFTEGVAVSYDSSFVGRLDRSLRVDNIEILNAGVVTYSPRLYYLKAREWISRKGLECDQLWVMLDNADIQDEIVYEGWSAGFWNYSALLSIYDKLKIRYKKITSPTISWDEKDYYAERERWMYDSAIERKWGQHGLLLAQKNIQLLKALCDSKQIVFKLLIFPRPEQIKRAALTDFYVQAWEKFCRIQQIEFISLYPTFIHPQDSPFNQQVLKDCFIPGDIHWNSRGHRLVAEALLPQLKK